MSWIPETSGQIIVHDTESIVEQPEISTVPQEEGYLGVPAPTIATSGSSDTLTGSLREFHSIPTFLSDCILSLCRHSIGEWSVISIESELRHFDWIHWLRRKR